MPNSVFGRRRFERDMKDEIDFHVDQQTQAHIREGLSPGDARRRALLEFGGRDAVEEGVRDTRMLTWLTNLLRDVRIAVRGLVKSPGFSFIAVLILAVAIGANTAIFSIVNATILRDLPYPQSDRLVGVWEANQSWRFMSISYPNFKDWQERQTTFEGMAICASRAGVFEIGNRSERLSVNFVTGQFFDILRVEPQVGRKMTLDDDRRGAAPVAWISDELWHEHFSADPEVVGEAFVLDGRSYTVAGVLPAGLRYHRPASIFIALEVSPEVGFMSDRSNRNNNAGIARLRDGTTLEAATAQMEGIAAQLAETYPGNKGVSVNVMPLQESLTNSARQRVYLLYGAVGLLLLIACVNIANMLLARGFARSREIAIRVALGATRWQVMRQLLIESLVLAMAGGLLGIVLAFHGARFAARLIPWEMRNLMGDAGVTFDPGVCAFALGVTVFTGLLFGFAPAWRLSHTRPNAILKDVPGALTGRRRCFSGTDMLVVAQVSLVVVLLVCTGLLLRSLQRVLDISPGIEPQGLVTFQVSPPSIDIFVNDPAGFRQFFDDVRAKLEGLPEVEIAAYGSAIPLGNQSSHIMFYRDDRPVPPEGELPSASVHYVSAGYFETMGIPLLKGRVFDGTEPPTKYPPGVPIALENAQVLFGGMTFNAVISDHMAKQFWPDEDPVGKHFHIGTPNWGMPMAVVVGVVGNTTQQGMESGEQSEFYLGTRQIQLSLQQFFVVRTRTDPANAMRVLKDAVESMAVGHPVFDLRLMQDRMDDSLADRRFNAQLFTFFAGAALLLAASGIYGVLSFVTGRRTRDIGVQLALGAPRSRVLREVLLRGLRLVALGLAVGLVGAFFTQRLLVGQLYGVTGTDPLAYIVGAILLLAISTVACLIPAWRAASVDPMTALRAE